MNSHYSLPSLYLQQFCRYHNNIIVIIIHIRMNIQLICQNHSSTRLLEKKLQMFDKNSLDKFIILYLIAQLCVAYYEGRKENLIVLVYQETHSLPLHYRGRKEALVGSLKLITFYHILVSRHTQAGACPPSHHRFSNTHTYTHTHTTHPHTHTYTHTHSSYEDCSVQ